MAVLLSPTCVWAADYHLAAAGDDANTGTPVVVERNILKGSVKSPGIGYRKPGVSIGEKFCAYIRYNCRAGEHRLNRSVIRNNVLYTDTEAKPLLSIGRKDESIDLVIEESHVRPYQPPMSGVAE